MLRIYVVCALLTARSAYRLQPQLTEVLQSTQEQGQPVMWHPPIEGFMGVELHDITDWVRPADSANVVRCCCEGTGWSPKSFFSGSKSSGPARCHVYVVRKLPAKCGDMRKPRWATSSVHHFDSTGGHCLVAAAEVDEVRDILRDPEKAKSQGIRATIPNSNVELTDVTDLIEAQDSAGHIRCCCDSQSQTISEYTPAALFDRISSERTNRCQVYGLSGLTESSKKSCGDYEVPDWASASMHHYKRTGACFIAASEVVSLLTYTGTASGYCKEIVGAPSMPPAALGDLVQPTDCPQGTIAKQVYCTYQSKSSGVFRPAPSCIPVAPKIGRTRPPATIPDSDTKPNKISGLAAAFGPVVKRPTRFSNGKSGEAQDTKFVKPEPLPPKKPEAVKTTTTTSTTTTSAVIAEAVVEEDAPMHLEESLAYPSVSEYEEFLDVKTFGRDLQRLVRIGEKVAANLNNPEWAKSLSGNYALTRLLHRPSSSSLVKKMQMPYYTAKPLQGMVVAIVGAGPGGLRLAVEATLMGAQVHLLESRAQFVRYNVMKLWAFTVQDMVSIGIKDLYPTLVSKSARRIPIASLQEALSRVALAVGVKMHVACKFHRLCRDESGEIFMETDASCENRDVVQELRFHAIFDGTGTRATLRENSWGDVPLIDTIRLGGSDAIGMTVNFKRFGTKGEAAFAAASKEDPRFNKYNPALADKADLSKQFARDLFNSKVVNLENWVYWQSELSHYFVLTISLKSLVDQGVVQSTKSTNATLEERLRSADKEKLVEMCLKIAEEWNVPHEAQDRSAFITNNRGDPDIAVFEFGSAKQSMNAAVILPGPEDSAPKLFGVVGDSLCTPFWPQGTGANRAHYSAHLQTLTLMAAWRGDRNYEAACALADEMERRLLAIPITGNKPGYTAKDYEAMMLANYNGMASGKIPAFH